MTETVILSKGERTSQAILDAAYHLFLTQGYTATSMRQIASASQLALGGIYNHFSGKDEIFQALILSKHPYIQILPLLQNAPGETPDEFLHSAVHIIQSEMDARPDFMKLMLIEVVEFGGSHFKKLYETVFPLVIPLLQRFSRPENGLRDLPIALIFRTLMGTIVSFYLTSLLMNDPTLPAELRSVTLESFMDIYLHGILKKDELW